MNELVLAIHAHELAKQVKPTGLSDFDLSQVDQHAYAMLPRHLVDNKNKLYGYSMQIGAVLPQVLPYFVVSNPDGRILTYQRKGKEEGLLGKWSIGIGGHISHDDFLTVADADWEALPNLNDIIFHGAKREVEEELGINADWLEMFNSPDDLEIMLNKIIYTNEDDTSKLHIAFTTTIELSEHMVDSLNLDPAEFNNYKWLTPEELKLCGLEFETWSAILIDNM